MISTIVLNTGRSRIGRRYRATPSPIRAPGTSSAKSPSSWTPKVARGRQRGERDQRDRRDERRREETECVRRERGERDHERWPRKTGRDGRERAHGTSSDLDSCRAPHGRADEDPDGGDGRGESDDDRHGPFVDSGQHDERCDEPSRNSPRAVLQRAPVSVVALGDDVAGPDDHADDQNRPWYEAGVDRHQAGGGDETDSDPSASLHGRPRSDEREDENDLNAAQPFSNTR